MASSSSRTLDHDPSRNQNQYDDPTPNRISLTIPHNLLVLPPTAAFIGLIIGMSRGGSRARLRFLAENAHRQPRTIQGWYFYTKTRNYRVFFSAAKTGSKYALGLGGATAAYCLLDESIGWSREKILGVAKDFKGKGKEKEPSNNVVGDVNSEAGGIMMRRESWREGEVKWEDGALAGGIMGIAVGIVYSLPRQLFIRSLIIGTLLGGCTSALQIVQDHIGRLRDRDALRAPGGLPPAEQILKKLDDDDDEILDNHNLVNRPAQEGAQICGLPVDEISSGEGGINGGAKNVKETGSWWSWIPGLGR